jgi:cytochrome b561
MSKPNGYSRLQIRLHWIIFGLIGNHAIGTACQSLEL